MTRSEVYDALRVWLQSHGFDVGYRVQKRFWNELEGTEGLKAEAKSQLEAIIKKFNLPADRVQAHVAEGSPKDKILEMAKKLPADMVIIASHRPDITTYLLGSNAAAVVRHAECSVLVVR
ncbi:universal stress protein [Salmonella enterica subsp. enterica serovar Cerro]|nr:universal stress protein [Salmonella enterica subsp. enterica serovar Cerro]